MNYNKKFNKNLSKRRFSKKLKKKSTRKIKRGGSQANNYLAKFDIFFKTFEDEAKKKFDPKKTNCNPQFEIKKINTAIDDFFKNQKEKFKSVLEDKIKCGQSNPNNPNNLSK